MEEYAYFGHYGGTVLVLGGSHLYGCQQVLLAIGAQCAYGQLATGEDYWLRQSFEHEA